MSTSTKRKSSGDAEDLHPPFKLPRLDVTALNKTDSKASVTGGSSHGKAWSTKPAKTVQELESDELDVEAHPSDLSDILDIRSCLPRSDITPLLHARFHSIASLLLNDYHLCIIKAPTNGFANDEVTRFELLEVEFYLRTPGHLDPFAHGTEEQRQSGRWYFHRAPRRSADASRSATGTGWRGGTRKGLDLTFGGPVSSTEEVIAPESSEDDIRGGILFRALLPVKGGSAVVGPSLCADAVLAAAGASNIKELVLAFWDSDTSALARNGRKGAIWLEKRASSGTDSQDKEETTIYVGPRVGLDLSHPGTTDVISDPRVRFVGAPLRFFRRPKLLMGKNRPHTVLGILRTIRTSRGGPEDDSLVPAGSPARQTVINSLVAITGLNESALSSALDSYVQGCTKDQIGAYVGLKGKGVGAKMDTYMRMSGALDAMGLS